MHKIYKNAKLYRSGLPGDVQDFYIMLGNKPNDQNMKTTFLEKMKMTKIIEKAWAAHRTAMGWSIGYLGQGEMDKRKFTFIMAWWATYRSY